MAIEDAVKIEKEVVAVPAAIVHDVVVLLLTRHYGAIIRGQDLAPDLVRTTSVYVCVSHGNTSKRFIFALPCSIL